MIFKVVLRSDLEDGGFNISCPALPGCHSQGDTEEEAIENIKDAIRGCLEVLNERALCLSTRGKMSNAALCCPD